MEGMGESNEKVLSQEFLENARPLLGSNEVNLISAIIFELEDGDSDPFVNNGADFPIYRFRQAVVLALNADTKTCDIGGICTEDYPPVKMEHISVTQVCSPNNPEPNPPSEPVQPP